MKKLLKALLAVTGVIAGLCSGQALGLAATTTQWRSVKTHGDCGELPIVLDPVATGATTTKPTTETRGKTAATQGVLKVQVDFDGPVTLADAAHITVTFYPTIQPPATPAVGSPVSVTPTSVSMEDADTLNIVFAPGLIPNMGCANIAIGAGTFVETITGDTDCNIRSLAGDVSGANGSGSVTEADFLTTKAQFMADSLPTTPGKAKYDVTLTCTLTYSDVLWVKAQVRANTMTALCP